ncbi:hypothetical protein TURU_142825 [Turdus rufiventris]|nr:hypothetical protein TURU_142825 [Turdus rufiventris]
MEKFLVLIMNSQPQNLLQAGAAPSLAVPQEPLEPLEVSLEPLEHLEHSEVSMEHLEVSLEPLEHLEHLEMSLEHLEVSLEPLERLEVSLEPLEVSPGVSQDVLVPFPPKPYRNPVTPVPAELGWIPADSWHVQEQWGGSGSVHLQNPSFNHRFWFIFCSVPPARVVKQRRSHPAHHRARL